MGEFLLGAAWQVNTKTLYKKFQRCILETYIFAGSLLSRKQIDRVGEQTGREKMRKTNYVLCAVGLVFFMPLLQHNFFHTTWFERFGETQNLLYAVFLAVLVASSAICYLQRQRFERAVACGSFLACANAIFSVLIFILLWHTNAPKSPLELAGAIVLVAAMGITFVLGWLSWAVVVSLPVQEGATRTVILIVVSAAAFGLVFVSDIFGHQVYRILAYVCLPASNCICLCINGQIKCQPDDTQNDAQNDTQNDTQNDVQNGDSNVSGGIGEGVTWDKRLKLLFCAFAIAQLSHTIFYFIDHDFDYVWDTPFALTTTLISFFLMILFLVVRHKHGLGLNSKAVWGLGMALIVGFFMGVLLTSIFERFASGSVFFAAGLTLSVLRSFNILLLIILIGESYQRNISVVQAFVIYLVCVQVIPYAVSYCLMPVLAQVFPFLQAIDLNLYSLFASFLMVLLLTVFLIVFARSNSFNSIFYEHETSGNLEHEAACDMIRDSAGLTARERDVLYYLSQGYTAKKISEILFVTEGTVHSHRVRIYSKMGIHSKNELIETVNRHALLENHD
jgi:DNA-binding CsgD family transcriptional regulator